MTSRRKRQMTDFTFTDSIRVLVYDCDFMGHVNNAVYVRYLQQVTTDGFAQRGLIPPDVVQKLSIQYQTFARYGDRLGVSAWMVESGQDRLLLGYRVVREVDDAPVVSAEIAWHYAGSPQDDAKDIGVRAIRPLNLYQEESSAYAHRSGHVVRSYELDQAGRVQDSIYFNWLEHATLQAAAGVGWPQERLDAAGAAIIQYRHDAEFFEAARGADEVEIISRLVATRRASGTWLHDVVRAADGTHLMRDYSTGVWMNASGGVCLAPDGMMEACVAGLDREAGLQQGAEITPGVGRHTDDGHSTRVQ